MRKRIGKGLLILLIISIGISLFPRSVSAWWDSSYTNRRKITFNNPTSTVALTDFPILVNLNSSRIDYSKTQNSGQDIRFVDSDDTTALDYEIDRWDETATSSVWVQVPSVATGTADYIWMYYNNPSATDGQHATSTWDSDFALVSHFNSTTSTPQDSTANANHGVNASSSQVSTTSTIAGWAVNFNGSNQRVTYPSSSSMANFAQKTIDVWFRKNVVNAVNVIAAKDIQTTGWEIFSLGNSASNRLRFRQTFSTGSFGSWTPTSGATSNTALYHMAIVYDNSSISNDPVFYWNGAVETLSSDTNATSGVAMDDTANGLMIGTNSNLGADFDGEIEELRYSNTLRSASWIGAEHYNGIDVFSTFGGEEGGLPGTPGTPTYTNVTTSTLTVNWASSTNTTYYKLERSTSGVSFAEIATTTTLSYGDSGLSSSTTYWYRVRGNSSSTGDGPYSASSSVSTSASTNINSGAAAHWAWNDLIGWIDFYTTRTIIVTSTDLTGYASSSAGEISLDCHTTSIGNICGSSNYQVLNDGNGNLSGWAWNDVYGWISFCGGQATSSCPLSTSYQVTIDTNGDFNGYAWNDVAGWISFNCANTGTCGTSNYKVNSTWTGTAASSTSGYLDSTTFDTGVTSGAQLNSVVWKGFLPSGTTVGLQFAVSNSSSGPWNYTGPDGTSNTYYQPSAPGTPIKLDYSLYNNFRYFRYRVKLFSDGDQTLTPRVDDVIVNWSP